MKNCTSALCTTPCTHVTHYWQKRSFRVFYMGHDRSWRMLEAAKNVLLYHSRHILSQHPCLHPSEAGKCINYLSASPTPPHTNPMELGPENTFSAQNPKNPKRFMIFNTEKRGSFFLDIFNPPPPPSPPPPLMTPQKSVFQVGGF